MTRLLLSDFGITAEDLMALARAYYPPDDYRLTPPRDAVAAGELRAKLRVLVVAIEDTDTDTEERDPQ